MSESMPLHTCRKVCLYTLVGKYAFTHVGKYAFTHVGKYAFTHVGKYAFTQCRNGCLYTLVGKYAFTHLSERLPLHTCRKVCLYTLVGEVAFTHFPETGCGRGPARKTQVVSFSPGGAVGVRGRVFTANRHGRGARKPKNSKM